MELLLLLVCFVLAFRLLRWLELPVLWAWILGAIAAVVLPVALVTFLNGILASIVASPLLALLLGLLLAYPAMDSLCACDVCVQETRVGG